jgi:NAD(P) transhydrogenase subunit alpha
MKIGVVKERAPNERRVALVPESLSKLTATGAEVLVETGAGDGAAIPDAAFADAGGRIVSDKELYAEADVVLRVQRPTPEEVRRLRKGQVVVGLLQPLIDPSAMKQLADAGVTAISLDALPRTLSRAQSMDALSSQANVGGYRAVLIAAEAYGRYFPLLTTAAGTAKPARVLVLGAGVAGLQAIATARRLGAVVQGFDIRPAVKEQVESLGAQWVGMALQEAEGTGGYAKEVSEETQRREHEHLHRLVSEADVVVTTAQIPGRPAPVLITEDMVDAMKAGAIIVDLAAETGGNCALTRADGEVRHGTALILGPTDLAAGMPIHASQMYSRNVEALIQHISDKGALKLEREDEIVRECLVTDGGDVVHPRVSATIPQER